MGKQINLVVKVLFCLFLYLYAGNDTAYAQIEDEYGWWNDIFDCLSDPNCDGLSIDGVYVENLDEVVVYAPAYNNDDLFYIPEDEEIPEDDPCVTNYDPCACGGDCDDEQPIDEAYLPPVPSEFNAVVVLSIPSVANISIRHKVTGVKTITIAPVKLTVVSMPSASLNSLVNLFNATSSVAVTPQGVVNGTANNLNNGTPLPTGVSAFNIWFQQLIINGLIDSYDEVIFDDCDGSCYCDSTCELTWYLDNDDDGYHADTTLSREQPTDGNWRTDTLGEDCDDNDPSKWELYYGDFSHHETLTAVGTGGPVTPEAPSITDDYVYGGGNSGLNVIPPSDDNLNAFIEAKSGKINHLGISLPILGGDVFIKENLLEKTEVELHTYFKDALELLTTGTTANTALGLLLEHFESGNGEPYFNELLSGIIDFGDGDADTFGNNDRTVGDFMKSLFEKICDELKKLEEECVGIINIDVTALKYPNFPLSDSNLIAQLGGIQGVRAFIDSDGNLSAELFDTFGVSEDDAIKRDSKIGNTISGGAIGTKAMRILQTHHGWRPFVHSVKINPLALGESNFNLNDCN